MEHLTDYQLREMYYSPKISRRAIEEIENDAIKLIKDVCANYKNICFGYSAGKDSIVVQRLLDDAEIEYSAVIWQTMFQFPENQAWIREHGPKNLIFEQISRPNIKDLQNDEDLLFTGTKKSDDTYMRYKWMAQKSYLAKQKFDLFVTGRRIAERNNCGARDKKFIRKNNNYDSFSPIATWSSRDVFAYLRYNNIELPWQYVNTVNGFAYGSVAWTERRRFGHLQATMKERLEEVYDADRNVLIALRNDIPRIDTFLLNKGV